MAYLYRWWHLGNIWDYELFSRSLKKNNWLHVCSLVTHGASYFLSKETAAKKKGWLCRAISDGAYWGSFPHLSYVRCHVGLPQIMRDRTADPKRFGCYGVVVWQCDRYPEDGTGTGRVGNWLTWNWKEGRGGVGSASNIERSMGVIYIPTRGILNHLDI